MEGSGESVIAQPLEEIVGNQKGLDNVVGGTLDLGARPWTALAVIMFTMLLAATAVYFRMFRRDEVFS